MSDRPILFSEPMVQALLGGRKTMTRRLTTNRAAARIEVGDVLWVREAWYSPPFLGSDTCLGYMADGVPSGPHRGRPSIHMPKEASRISLLVTGKRVERVRSITEADVMAEGVARVPSADGSLMWWCAAGHSYCHPRRAFEALWCSINGPESWDANHEVFAFTFERAPTPEATR